MRPLVRLISRLLPWLMAASASAAQPLRVMPLGDSITAGSYGAGKDGIGGYRAVLAQQCATAKLTVDFVGSLNDPKNAPFDADHEGHRAWRIDQLTDQINGWFAAARPEVILLQIGINDLIQGTSTEEAAARFSRLLDTCRAKAPATRIYVAAINPVREPNDYHVSPAAVDWVNARIRQLVADRASQGMKIVFVDMPTACAFAPEDFSPDGLHPSDRGYAKMAAVWFRVLRGQFDLPITGN